MKIARASVHASRPERGGEHRHQRDARKGESVGSVHRRSGDASCGGRLRGFANGNRRNRTVHHEAEARLSDLPGRLAVGDLRRGGRGRRCDRGRRGAGGLLAVAAGLAASEAVRLLARLEGSREWRRGRSRGPRGRRRSLWGRRSAGAGRCRCVRRCLRSERFPGPRRRTGRTGPGGHDGRHLGRRRRWRTGCFSESSTTAGRWSLLVLVGTFVGDTAAHLFGSLFGKTPLAPSISPNKTVEGLVAGIAAAPLAVVCVALAAEPWLGHGRGGPVRAGRRDRGAARRPVGIDHQEGSWRQGLGHAARRARRRARPSRCALVHCAVGLLPGNWLWYERRASCARTSCRSSS